MGSCAHSRGRGAAIRRSALSGVVTALVLLTGCAVGGEIPDASPEPRAELAEKAEVAVENAGRPTPGREQGRRERRAKAGAGDATAASTGADGGAGSGAEYAGASDGSGSQEAGAETSRTDHPGTPWIELAGLEDPAGDHGSGPAYADLARVEFSERGDELAVAVTVRATVPGILADREVQGVGIDLFRSSGEESDYQVFLDGGDHGWRAFLQTPDGFVDFPGAFAVEGRTLRVVVPWHAVGGRAEAEASVFVDWSSGVGRLSTDGTTRVGLLADGP